MDAVQWGAAALVTLTLVGAIAGRALDRVPALSKKAVTALRAGREVREELHKLRASSPGSAHKGRDERGQVTKQ